MNKTNISRTVLMYMVHPVFGRLSLDRFIRDEKELKSLVADPLAKRKKQHNLLLWQTRYLTIISIQAAEERGQKIYKIQVDWTGY